MARSRPSSSRSTRLGRGRHGAPEQRVVKQHRVQRHPWIRSSTSPGSSRRTAPPGGRPRRRSSTPRSATTSPTRRTRRSSCGGSIATIGRVAVVRQTIDLLSETIIAFVQSYFTNTPEMPEAQRKLGATTARRRLDDLLDAAARRYAGGARLLDRAAEGSAWETPSELAAAARRRPRRRRERRSMSLDDGEYHAPTAGVPARRDRADPARFSKMPR